MVDDQKIKAILEWEKPKTTKGLRSFLGLASYYRKFVRGLHQNCQAIIGPLEEIGVENMG